MAFQGERWRSASQPVAAPPGLGSPGWMRAKSSYLVRVAGVDSMRRRLLALLQGLFGRLLGAIAMRFGFGMSQIHIKPVLARRMRQGQYS